MSFNGNRLRLARQFHGWNLRDLASLTAVSHSAIALFEKGHKSPRGEVQEALAVVLKVDRSYFSLQDVEEFREEDANFRRRIAATERQRKQVLAHASLFAEVSRYLQREVAVPTLGVPTATPGSLDDVENIANDVRKHFGIALDAPIGSVARLLENAGVLTLAVDIKTAEKVDALSCYGTTSVVILNTEKDSPSRTLFEEAHEFGHGVLHRSGRVLTLDQREAEANRFAGALLLPRDAFAAEMLAVRPNEWTRLFEIKRHWGPSIKAILYRAYQLGLMDAADYRTRMKYYSYRGWNSGEPDEPMRDRPTMFARMFSAYKVATGETARDIARSLGWTIDLFASVTGLDVDSPEPDVISLAQFRSQNQSQ